MAVVNSYTVLSKDTLEEISKACGLSVVELSETLRQSELFDFTQIYWTFGQSYWYTCRFDNQSVSVWGLERLAYEAQLRTELI